MKKKTTMIIGAFLICLSLPACGPLLDLADMAQPLKYGPMTPRGQIKRDFWGQTYIEPYPWLLDQAKPPDSTSKPSTDKTEMMKEEG